MTTIILLLLFVSQLISYYFIALLYLKVSKFDNLEKKQNSLMREMDDSLTVYLSELKDENDRLIGKLSANQENKPGAPIHDAPLPVVEAVVPSSDKSLGIRINTPKLPVNLALKSYGASNILSASPKQMDERTRALHLHDKGHTIEEIAKKLGKGRTEVELILKFR